jgi:hypothetical protein
MGSPTACFEKCLKKVASRANFSINFYGSIARKPFVTVGRHDLPKLFQKSYQTSQFHYLKKFKTTFLKG